MLLLLAVPVFAVAIAIEAILDHAFGINNYQWKDSSTSIFMGLASLFIDAIPRLLTGPLLQYLEQFAIFSVQPTIGWYLLLIVLYDFSFYWSHRSSHRCRLLWASHVVHHSSEKFTLATALRQSWTDIIFNTIFYLYLPIIGFPLHMFRNVAAINLIYQFWTHSKFIICLDRADYLLNTPKHHSIHHASNVEYLDCNYGGMFIIFDRIFGTFVEEKNIKIVYGITTPINTYNPLKVAFHEWIDMISDCKRALMMNKKWDAFKYVFAPPGWQPT